MLQCLLHICPAEYDTHQIDAMRQLVSAQRGEYAMSYRHAAGQYASLVSFLMLRTALLRCFDISIADANMLEYTLTNHGKPQLKHYPHLHFSISHTRKAVAVAVADHEVGADIEGCRNISEALIGYVMNSDEACQIAMAANKESCFAKIWTQKEALAKLRGTGIGNNIKQLLPCREQIATHRIGNLYLSIAIGEEQQFPDEYISQLTIEELMQEQ